MRRASIIGIMKRGSPIRSGMTCDRSGMTCGGPGLLKGGAYTSHHDHRMVMALKVASLGADSPITIDDEACVAKSFPQFNELFDLVAFSSAPGW